MVFEMVEVVWLFGVYVWVDGGVWYLRDVVFVLVVGVVFVMIGLWFVGMIEVFGLLEMDDVGCLYK